MTNRTMKFFPKVWDSLRRWETAMDYSAGDYTDDRIRWLEQEVKTLKEELRRTRASAGTADGGFEQ
jgi:hypothetical protein